ncbi:MAG: acyl carrier protein [Rubrivivax sp.]|jgi:acyl carrier protein|nr:MAG: acyl carrier protein [Rubrivivax sp.]
MNSADLIRTFLVERLGIEPDTVQPGALLVDLGVDSLMLAELMFEAEDRLGIQIPSDLQLPSTVADMQATLDRLTNAKSG